MTEPELTTTPYAPTETTYEDGCMRATPMAFCKVCGTWMHCKPDGAGEYERRSETNHNEPSRLSAP
jgi:hypothetical protein